MILRSPTTQERVAEARRALHRLHRATAAEGVLLDRDTPADDPSLYLARYAAALAARDLDRLGLGFQARLIYARLGR